MLLFFKTRIDFDYFMFKIAQISVTEVIMSTLNVIKLTILLSALVTSVYAGSFPRGCEVTGFGFNQNNLILNSTGEQAFYLIQNRSNDSIELERYDYNDSFMSPPLQATFEPMTWGAFASDEKNLNFKCYKHLETNTTLVDCREVLEVCQYPRVKFALSNMGNYWISSNKSQSEVIHDSVAKGIYLKW